MGFLALQAALTGSHTPPPSVLLSPSPIAVANTTASQTTPSCAATASGGQAPFTYAWTQVSGGSFTINTSSAAATTFTAATLSSAGETRTGVFRCTVTDALGRTASAQVNVSVQRYATLSASASPSSLSNSGNTATVTTASDTCSASGGSGSYSYSWVKVSGGSITAVSASSATSAFRGSTMTAGEARSATFRCDVTDTVSGQTASTANITINVNRYAALTANVTPATVSGSGTTGTITSASASGAGGGGSGSYSYAWAKTSGGAITAVAASSASSTFRGTSMLNGEVRTAVFTCTVTDTVTGATATDTVSITLTNTVAFTAAASPASVSGSGAGATITSASSTATPTGGNGSYTYAWAKVSGGSIVAVSATSAASAFRATTMANSEVRSAVFKCTVTDVATGNTAVTGNVTITLTNTTASLTFTPAGGSYSADDGGPGSATQFSITASASVVWTWSHTGSLVTANIASGSSGTTITFTQGNGTNDKSSTVTVSSNGSSWTIAMQNTGSGDPLCVVVESVLPSHESAELVAVDDELELVNPATFARRKGKVTRADRGFAECVLITTISGVELECSTTAPIGVQDGSFVAAPDLLGEMVAVEDFGVERHEAVASVVPIGMRAVMHITVENEAFLAGKVKGRYLVHHNLKP